MSDKWVILTVLAVDVLGVAQKDFKLIKQINIALIYIIKPIEIQKCFNTYLAWISEIYFPNTATGTKVLSSTYSCGNDFYIYLKIQSLYCDKESLIKSCFQKRPHTRFHTFIAMQMVQNYNVNGNENKNRNFLILVLCILPNEF